MGEFWGHPQYARKLRRQTLYLQKLRIKGENPGEIAFGAKIGQKTGFFWQIFVRIFGFSRKLPEFGNRTMSPSVVQNFKKIRIFLLPALVFTTVLNTGLCTIQPGTGTAPHSHLVLILEEQFLFCSWLLQ